MSDERAASRGRPSYVWGFGQERRLAMFRRYVPAGGAALDIGCGIGTFLAELGDVGAKSIGIDIDWPRVREARTAGHSVAVAYAEALPLEAGSLDFVLLNEVLEHVADDGQALREVARILAPGGHAVVFAPNRWWPFETHGIMWRGEYRMGNFPLVNYLPDPIRSRLAPHVRVYRAETLRHLAADEPLHVVLHTQVFPGFDKLAQRRPTLGRALRRLCYLLERTPLRRFGLSHLLILKRISR